MPGYLVSFPPSLASGCSIRVVTSGTRPNWYTDWALRCFQQFLGTVVINDLYRLVVHELHVGGVLEEIGNTRTKHAYGISADALLCDP